jgi:uncharacterized membrane protein YfcA
MIFILITLILPTKKVENVSEKLKRSFLIYPAMLLIGFYGGFIQIGIGFILMAAFRHLMQYDLLRVNLHKTFVVLIYSLPVLLIFGFSGKINWLYALAISMGNAVGSYFSVKLALKKGEKVVKVMLIIAILIMAIKFFIE